MTRKFIAIAALSVMLLGTVSARANGQGSGFTTGTCALDSHDWPGSTGHVITVGAGQQFASIQAGVDAAAPGDTVLVYPGTYNEAVTVETPGLRLIGTDRQGVVLDGGSTLNIGVGVYADHVQIENMTAHNYVQHGFYWFRQIGYRGSYLTTWDNGDYGIFAFDARCGEFDHDFASGNQDSGFYIGNCFPCDAVVHDIVSENNALGYSGTNAGGNLVLRDSVWKGNGLGIVPNSLDSEARPPERGITIKNNLVENNNGIDTPGVGIAGEYWGGGIVLAGTQGDVVYGNTVTGHALGGILITELPDTNVWVPSGNVVWGNKVDGQAGAYDLAQAAGSGPNNCWSDNTHLDGSAIDATTTAPAILQNAWSCGYTVTVSGTGVGGTVTPPGGDPRAELNLAEGQVPGPDGSTPLNGRVHSPWQTYPVPDDAVTQPTEDGAAIAGPISAWLPALGY